QAVGSAAWRAEGGGGGERLHLDEERACPLHTDDDRRAGSASSVLGEEEGRGILDIYHALAAHFKDTHLVGGAEAVLDAAQEAVGMVALALEVEHGVHNVLEGAGTGYGALFGDMANDEDGYVTAFGKAHQAEGAVADLADAAWGRNDLGGGDGLDGVHDDEGGLEALGKLDDGLQLGLRQEQEAVGGDAEALGA